MPDLIIPFLIVPCEFFFESDRVKFLVLIHVREKRKEKRKKNEYRISPVFYDVFLVYANICKTHDG